MFGIEADCIKDKQEQILCLWEARCLQEVTSARSSGSLALRNSLPLYLDHLSDALATNRRMDLRSVSLHDEESTRIGKLHGADRATNRSYTLNEVIVEYHILREVLFQVLETEGPLAQGPRDIVLDSIEQAVNDAVVKFTELHTDIQQTFIHTLTHDLKTPIWVARTNANLISKGASLTDPHKKSIRNILVSLNRLDSMIHDLLDVSRVRAGERLHLQFIHCDLEALIREVVEELTMVYGDRIVLDSNGPLEGNWGSDGLKRAVENLIGNAVKYGASRTPITVSLKGGTEVAEIGVHNEGPVLTENEIPRLFQNFQRATRAEDGTQSGWGLGLTVVKGVVEAHKGKIRVESSEGKGTRFVLKIPRAVAKSIDE
jgi:signal transduction histidine kinase